MEWAVCTALSCQAHDQVLEDGFLLLYLTAIPFPRGITEIALLASGSWASQWVRKIIRLRKERAKSHQTWNQIPTLPFTGVTLGVAFYLSEPVFSLVKMGIKMSLQVKTK